MLSEDTETSIGPGGAADPQADLPDTSLPDGIAVTAETSTGKSGGDVLESVFAWIRDILDALFGSGDASADDGGAVAEETPVDPPVEPPVMDGDIILNAVIPVFEIPEEGEFDLDDEGDALADELALLF